MIVKDNISPASTSDAAIKLVIEASSFKSAVFTVAVGASFVLTTSTLKLANNVDRVPSLTDMTILALVPT